jgi:hypothetical protein
MGRIGLHVPTRFQALGRQKYGTFWPATLGGHEDQRTQNGKYLSAHAIVNKTNI